MESARTCLNAFWPGNAPGSRRKSWRTRLGRRMLTWAALLPHNATYVDKGWENGRIDVKKNM